MNVFINLCIVLSLSNPRLMSRLYLLSCIFLAFFIPVCAQNAKLQLQPNEVRVIAGKFVVEKQNLIIVPNSGYTIGDGGRIFILPEIEAPRNIQLPPAAQNALREITMIDKTVGTNRWTIVGSIVTKQVKGNPPYVPENNMEVGQGAQVTLFSDGTSWYDISVGGGTGGGGIPPSVDADSSQSLPSTATQTTLNAVVTTGTSSIYTVLWEIAVQPATASAVITNPAQANTTVTNMIPGNYTFRITVTDDLGMRALDSIRVYISQPAQMFASGGFNDNVYDPATGRKTWIYLPDGYNPEDEKKYPLVIFLHGAGENGTDIQVMLTSTAGLPKLLYDRSFPMESIVIMPQLTDGFWNGPKAKAAYDWAVEGYKVDLDRVYVTGLSSGGGGACDVVYANPTLFAGYISIAPVDNTLQLYGPSVKNIPALFVHGYSDPYVPPYVTFDCINSINGAVPKGVYPPLVRMIWTGIHEVSLWNNYVYDKRIAPFDFERDFLLMHTRNRVQTATNYVERAETFNDYTEYAKAKTIVDKLASSQDKTNLLSRLATKLTQLTATNKYYIIDPGVSTYTEVANTNKVTSAAANTLKESLVDITGTASAIDFRVVSSTDPVPRDSCPDNDYMGFHQTMYRDGMRIVGAGSEWQLKDLPLTSSYDIRIFYSNKSTNRVDRTGFTITANGKTAQSVEDGWNTTNYIELFNVTPNAQGEINMVLQPLYGYEATVNVILLKEKTSPGAVQKAQYDFRFTPGNISGWTSVYGDPATTVLEVENEPTGWILSTVNTANWQKYFQWYAADDDGMSTGTFAPEFPADVVRSYFLNFNLKFNGNNYNLELKRPDGQGLPAGTYQVKIISSVKSTVNTTGAGDINVKFGSAATQLQHIIPTDNTQDFRTFTGMISEGETIKVSINRSAQNTSDISYISALIIEKVD